MEKPQFTPGPYRAIDAAEYCAIFGYVNKKDSPILGDDICIITDEDNPWTICTVNSGQPGERGPDAELLARSPEMYDLLLGIATVIRSADNDPNYSLPSHIAGIAPKIEELLCKITDR